MSNTSRPNKSHKIIEELKYLAHEEISIANPLADVLKKTAKHIEWLELLVTGITGRERNTIAMLTRLTKRQTRMIALRDEKNMHMVRERKAAKADYASEIAGLKQDFKDEIEWLKNEKIDATLPEIREQIEKEFIKKLLTTQESEAGEHAVDMLRSQLKYIAPPDGGWQTVSSSGTSTY